MVTDHPGVVGLAVAVKRSLGMAALNVGRAATFQENAQTVSVVCIHILNK